MKLEFTLEIPEKYVDLEVMNNYRQKAEKIDKDKFKIIVSDTPMEIIEIVRKKKVEFKIPKEIKAVEHTIESLEDFFYIISDYIDSVASKYQEASSPFLEYYNGIYVNNCGMRNRLFKKFLEKVGFKTRLIGGIYLDSKFFEMREVKATHVWVEVKIDDIWIEVDASGSLFPTFSCVRMNYLKKWDKFDLDFWIKGRVSPRIY